MSIACAAVALSSVSCVAPARTYPAYVADAVATAQEAESALQTGVLAAQTAGRNRAFPNYVSTALDDAETTASSVESQFDSEQPPSSAADRLRHHLDSMLSSVVSGLARLRIHARRGELHALPALARPLVHTSQNLDEFVKAHQ
jgi:hypothetical protein